ncbi:MAG TPA: YceI family protein [Bacteroidales bacterium]|nr:YceI family protein [Bacteroidales bacterium]
MKTNILALLALVQLPFTATFAQTYTVDAAKSTLNWRAEKITGFHEGTISIKSGSFQVEKDKIVSGSFVIDMTTLANTDLTDPEYNKKLVGHLKSSDFFDIAKFSEATFTILKPVDLTKSVTEVQGILSIKGIKKPLTFKTVITKAAGSYIFNANSIVVDRTAYDIKYGSGTFFSDLGDKVIYDEFLVKLKLIATR